MIQDLLTRQEGRRFVAPADVFCEKNQILFIDSVWACDTIWRDWRFSALLQVMAWHLFGAKSLPEDIDLIIFSN